MENHAETYDLLGMIVDERIARIAREIWDNIPDPDARYLDNNKMIIFVCSPSGASMKIPNIDLWDVPDIHLIYLDWDLANSADHEIIYCIARSIATARLEWNIIKKPLFDDTFRAEGKSEEEMKERRKECFVNEQDVQEFAIKVDRKVCEWGYMDEVKKTPYNRLYTNGSPALRLVKSNSKCTGEDKGKS